MQKVLVLTALASLLGTAPARADFVMSEPSPPEAPSVAVGQPSARPNHVPVRTHARRRRPRLRPTGAARLRGAPDRPSLRPGHLWAGRRHQRPRRLDRRRALGPGPPRRHRTPRPPSRHRPGRGRAPPLTPFAGNRPTNLPSDGAPYARPRRRPCHRLAQQGRTCPRRRLLAAADPADRAAPAADRLAGLGQSLDAAVAADADALRRALCDGPLRSDFRSVLAQLGAARLLRVLHWLGEELADHEPALALIADDCPDAAALRSAIDNLVRQATLARLFDRSRIDGAGSRRYHRQTGERVMHAVRVAAVAVISGRGAERRSARADVNRPVYRQPRNTEQFADQSARRRFADQSAEHRRHHRQPRRHAEQSGNQLSQHQRRRLHR